MSTATIISLFQILALACVAGAVSWLALEVRLARCGKIAPKVMTALEALPDRYDTYHLDHRASDALRRDYA